MKVPRRLGTKREFRCRKRREFIALLKAARALRFGCAFMPAVQIGALVDQIEAVYKKLKPWWGNA